MAGWAARWQKSWSEGCPVPLERVGIRDHFCPTGRDLDKLMDACGLSVAEVVAAAQRALARKKHPDDIP